MSWKLLQVFFFWNKLWRLEHVLFLQVSFASHFWKQFSKENFLRFQLHKMECSVLSNLYLSMSICQGQTEMTITCRFSRWKMGKRNSKSPKNSSGLTVVYMYPGFPGVSSLKMWRRDASVEKCTVAKCLLNTPPVIVLPSGFCLFKATGRYSRLPETKFGAVWFLLQLQCHVWVMSFRPRLEPPAHLDLLVRNLVLHKKNQEHHFTGADPGFEKGKICQGV